MQTVTQDGLKCKDVYDNSLIALPTIAIAANMRATFQNGLPATTFYMADGVGAEVGGVPSATEDTFVTAPALKTTSLAAAFADGISADAAIDIQLLSLQSQNLQYWRDMKVPNAELFSLTTDPAKMIVHRGKSFLARGNFPVADKEGGIGIYDRGWEGVGKIGSINIRAEWISDPARYAAKKDRVVLYNMIHGWAPVPPAITGETTSGRISTIHRTSFLHDLIPGTIQHTSTGAGHFQGSSLDVKQVTHGSGIQFNVRYDDDGMITHVYATEARVGGWVFALPGHVDYMVNTGGLKFNDLSIRLDDHEARLFERGSKVAPKLAPCLVARGGIEHMVSDDLAVKWWNPPQADIAEILRHDDLIDLYLGLTPGRLIPVVSIAKIL